MDKLKLDFSFFRDHCINIRAEYNLYSNIFSEGNQGLLSEIAATFFTDIAEIIDRDWKLQVCKVMDKSEMNGKENITIDLINEQLQQKDVYSQEIDEVSSSLKSFGKKLKTLRNKRLAHFDRDTQLRGQPLGGSSMKELQEFLADLQSYCDLVGNVIGVGPLDFSCSACDGDELDFLRKLKSIGGRNQDSDAAN